MNVLCFFHGKNHPGLRPPLLGRGILHPTPFATLKIIDNRNGQSLIINYSLFIPLFNSFKSSPVSSVETTTHLV